MSRYLYDLEQSIEEKIDVIAKQIYGAEKVDISPAARVQIERYKLQVRKFVRFKSTRKPSTSLNLQRVLMTSRFAWRKLIYHCRTILH